LKARVLHTDPTDDLSLIWLWSLPTPRGAYRDEKIDSILAENYCTCLEQSFAVVGVGTPTGTAMPGGVGGAATLTALALVIGAQFIKRKNK
jgi:hypothetical protein